MERLFVLYHELRPEPSQYSYVISCAEFEEHCRLYRNLHLRQSEEKGDLRPEVTFDDGYLSDFRFALPRLQAAGLRAHFFITAGWTGKRAGYMTAVELRELHAAGMTLGAHGWSHKLLTACTDAELKTELVDAKSRLEDLLGSDISTMSLPGGRADRRVFRHCEQAGYKAIFTSEPRPTGVIHRGQALQEPLGVVGRVNLRSGTSTAWLGQLLDLKTGALARQGRSDRVKSLAKTLLGDRLYAAAWGMVNRHEAETPDPGATA